MHVCTRGFTFGFLWPGNFSVSENTPMGRNAREPCRAPYISSEAGVSFYIFSSGCSLFAAMDPQVQALLSQGQQAVEAIAAAAMPNAAAQQRAGSHAPDACMTLVAPYNGFLMLPVFTKASTWGKRIAKLRLDRCSARARQTAFATNQRTSCAVAGMGRRVRLRRWYNLHQPCHVCRRMYGGHVCRHM